jgi:hypothetical protein
VTTINTIKARLNSIDLKQEIKTSLESTKGQVADLNRERMLGGKLADGSNLPNYSPVSVSVYGYPPGPWRLKATGAFQAAITVAVQPTELTTTSTDEKTAMLIGKVNAKGLKGSAIFGLDKAGKLEYINNLRPVFQNQVRNKLGL